MTLCQRLNERMTLLQEEQVLAAVKRRCSDILDEWWSGFDDEYQYKYPSVKHEMWERLGAVYDCDEWEEAVDEWSDMYGLDLTRELFDGQ